MFKKTTIAVVILIAALIVLNVIVWTHVVAEGMRAGRIRAVLVQPASSINTKYTEMLSTIVRLRHSASMGSGVLVYRERTVRNIRYVYYVITNEHVIAGRFTTKLNVDGLRESHGMALADPGVIVRVFDNAATKWKEYDGEVIVESSENDLALVKFQTNDYLSNIVALTNTEAVSQTEIFDPVYAVGCQLGDLSIPTEGIVSAFIHKDNRMLIIHTAHILPGSSGGGLFKKHDGRYHLIGLPFAVRWHNFQLIPHYSYAISAEMIYRFLHENDMSFIYENGMIDEV